jgi:hypothetical protein
MYTKGDFVRIFSSICNVIADDVPGFLLPHLEDDSESIAPFFGDTVIPDIHDWWDVDDHMKDFLRLNLSKEKSEPGYIKRFVEETLTMMMSNPDLMAEIESVYESAGGEANDREAVQEMLLYTDHVVTYAKCLEEAEGYKRLDEILDKIDNVVAVPSITLNPNAKTLDSAFTLQVIIVSADQTPLKPKLEKLPRFTA